MQPKDIDVLKDSDLLLLGRCRLFLLFLTMRIQGEELFFLLPLFVHFLRRRLLQLHALDKVVKTGVILSKGREAVVEKQSPCLVLAFFKAAGLSQSEEVDIVEAIRTRREGIGLSAKPSKEKTKEKEEKGETKKKRERRKKGEGRKRKKRDERNSYRSVYRVVLCLVFVLPPGYK